MTPQAAGNQIGSAQNRLCLEESDFVTADTNGQRVDDEASVKQAKWLSPLVVLPLFNLPSTNHPAWVGAWAWSVLETGHPVHREKPQYPLLRLC